MHSKHMRSAAGLIVALLPIGIMYGQAGGTARIYGSVRDASGAVIPEVTVTAHNLDTETERQAGHDRHWRLRVT